MLELKSAVRLASLLASGLVLAALPSCRPIGASDPLDQDAFATEAPHVIRVNP